MIKKIWLVGVLVSALLPGEAAGQRAEDSVAALLALRTMDSRVLSIGHRLAVANADLCADRAVATGIVLHGLSQYGPDSRSLASAAFGLGKQPAILALASGSAGQKAGIREDDQILKIGEQIFEPDRPGEKRSFAVVAGWTVQMEGALQPGEPIPIEILRNGAHVSLEFSPEQGCPSRFQVDVSSRFGGKADGNYVQLTSNLVQRVDNDSQLAAVLAHELAHNILRHRVQLNEAGVSRGVLKYFGKSASGIRRTEVEADRLSVYLLDRAGYPPTAAEAFWKRFGPQHPWGPFGSPTHPGWRSRVTSLSAEVSDLSRRKAAGCARPLPDFVAAAGIRRDC